MAKTSLPDSIKLKVIKLLITFNEWKGTYEYGSSNGKTNINNGGAVFDGTPQLK